jgi:hypothetical protein
VGPAWGVGGGREFYGPGSRDVHGAGTPAAS